MKLIIWDFDGTLVDSRPLIVAGMDHALTVLGLPLDTKDEWLKYVGLPVEKGVENTFGPLGFETDVVLKAYRSFGHAENEHLLTPFEGMNDLLAELKAKGIPMALATSKRGLPLKRQLAMLGWMEYFDPMITPDEVTHGKPHPESLDLVLAHHHLKAEDAIMVGDTPFDLEMAQRAKMPSLAVGHGFYDQASLLAYAPRGYATDTSALRDLLLAYWEA